MNREEIERKVASYPRWHYAFDLDGVSTFRPGQTKVNRHVQRKRLFFDPLVAMLGGSLAGKRVLDLGCNAGFWSLCAIEAGCAQVVGIDGRGMHVSQANLVFEVKNVPRDRYRFIQANIFGLDLASLGAFDIVLCLGLLYHVNRPVELLEAISAVNREIAVIDTTLARLEVPAFVLKIESSDDPRNAVESGLVMVPTASAVVMAMEHLGYDAIPCEREFESYDECADYRNGLRRAFIFRKRPGR